MSGTKIQAGEHANLFLPPPPPPPTGRPEGAFQEHARPSRKPVGIKNYSRQPYASAVPRPGGTDRRPGEASSPGTLSRMTSYQPARSEVEQDGMELGLLNAGALNFPPPPIRANGDDSPVTRGEFKQLVRETNREDAKPFWRNSEGWKNTKNYSIKNGLGHVWNQKGRIALFGVGYVFNGINFALVKNRTSYLDQHYGQLFCDIQQVTPFLSDPSQCEQYMNKRSLDNVRVTDDIHSKSDSMTLCLANDIYKMATGQNLTHIENPEDCKDILDNNRFSEKQLDSFARHHGLDREVLNQLTTSTI